MTNNNSHQNSMELYEDDEISSNQETPTSVSKTSIDTSSTTANDSIDPAISSGLDISTSDIKLEDLNFVQKLGSGDIGTVYLVELKRSEGRSFFAAKVMDREELAYRNKESRALIEREILEILDHPFLPSLYGALESPRLSCLLTEFCPGGDLHVLRQRQPDKRFHEDAVRFYASEVLVALEYLHMLGVIYRDLKPENVLVRSDGHIMLTDFDLSLKCDDSASKAHLVYEPNHHHHHNQNPNNSPSRFSLPSCILPTCIKSSGRKKRNKKGSSKAHYRTATNKPKVVAEPIDARSMSFVGTHEYLAPEIVSGEAHGNAVDWWTFGIFMYELFYGVTPFKGGDDDFTLSNIVARGLEFPKEPDVGSKAKGLMSALLHKDPCKRMGSLMGASAIKCHEFFDGVNWALLRCATPPYVPKGFDGGDDDGDRVDCF